MTEIGAFINAQTEDASPDPSNDFLLSYDASANAVKKVKIESIAIAGAGDMTYAALLACQLQNEIKGWPPVVNTGNLDALNLWFDKVGTPTTAPSVVALSGEGITENYGLALKVVASAENQGLSQRFTYANEPRIKAGRRLSTLWAIWCVGGVGVTLSIVNSSTEVTAAVKVTSASWTIVEVPNHLLAGTYCDIKLVTDGAGTFYAAPLGANIGARGFPLRARGLRYVDAQAVDVLSADPGGADWADLDLTASASALAVSANLSVLYRNTTTIDRKICFRRNGSAAAEDRSTTVISNPATSSSETTINVLQMPLDDGQVFEWKSDALATNAELLIISVFGYWEWE